MNFNEALVAAGSVAATPCEIGPIARAKTIAEANNFFLIFYSE
jgi:hypothetical protein